MPDLKPFVQRALSVRVLVIGDCMLDAYVAGTVSRISPEAPVPVVEVSRRHYVAGGAANVAANIRSLGAGVSVAGVTGTDRSGARLRQELEMRGIGTATLVEEPSRVTTTKTRVTASGQQIVRFDDEETSALPEAVRDELRARCAAAFESCDVCVLSDYAKGVLDASTCGWLIAEAARRKLPVVVDPKSRDLTRYRGATLITPNLKEATAAAGEGCRSLAEVAERLLGDIAPSALLVTQGEGGMSLFQENQPVWHMPALVNEVADVTGAGDTVVAALAIALGMRLSLYEAAKIANIAAGVAVSHHGTWAVKADELVAYADTAGVTQQ